jgi:hypothetical protein
LRKVRDGAEARIRAREAAGAMNTKVPGSRIASPPENPERLRTEAS